MTKAGIVLAGLLGLGALLGPDRAVARYCGPYGLFGEQICCVAADPGSFQSGKLCGEITLPDGTNVIGGCIDLTTAPPTPPGGCVGPATTAASGCPASAAAACAYCGCSVPAE